MTITSGQEKTATTQSMTSTTTKPASGGSNTELGSGHGRTEAYLARAGNQNTAGSSSYNRNYFCGCRDCYCGAAVECPGDVCSTCSRYHY